MCRVLIVCRFFAATQQPEFWLLQQWFADSEPHITAHLAMKCDVALKALPGANALACDDEKFVDQLW
jgi:hypothetical protein